MQTDVLVTPEEYLAFEAEAEIKHEYWIVEADRSHVVRYERREGNILVHMIPDLDQSLQSKALGVSIPLREIYRRVLT